MNWINAKHNLPIDNRPVLAGFKDDIPRVGFHDYEDNKTWKFIDYAGNIFTIGDEVTHWMYISKTPTVNNEHYNKDTLLESLFTSIFTIEHLLSLEQDIKTECSGNGIVRHSYEIHVNTNTSKIFTNHPNFIELEHYPDRVQILPTEIGALHNFRICIDENTTAYRVEIK